MRGNEGTVGVKGEGEGGRLNVHGLWTSMGFFVHGLWTSTADLLTVWGSRGQKTRGCQQTTCEAPASTKGEHQCAE